MIDLYPMKFRPRFVEKIWGGSRIKNEFGFEEAPEKQCGEAWILSGVPGNETEVINGELKGNTLSDIAEVFMGDLMGDQIYKENGSEFPVLIKLIDAEQWLSVQVHPDDEMAEERHDARGKTEMWYIIDAEKDAKLISGLSKDLDRNSFLFVAENNLIRDVLNYENVEKGDVFFTPAGRVHAIGPGILLAEIQQTSDITYRIFDWDRVGDDGKPREMHLSESLDAIDYDLVDEYKTKYERTEDKTHNIVDTDFFSTNYLKTAHSIRKDYSTLDSFVILVFTKGQGHINWDDQQIDFEKGEAILIPAAMDSVELHPHGEMEVLEVYIMAPEPEEKPKS